MYRFTYVFERGALGSPDTGYIELKDIWGSADEQFGIEVTDHGSLRIHKFPDIQFGDYPEAKPE
ncbi:MAG: hypothetical protein DRR19_08640 [Candidatus Parabeggiatoa sp. nov. 1]|nr:MAG: hypothetical protein DRR19_08640 [Gammaproteobacteria bacterium]